jgi:hypothetical protein
MEAISITHSAYTHLMRAGYALSIGAWPALAFTLSGCSPFSGTTNSESVGEGNVDAGALDAAVSSDGAMNGSGDASVGGDAYRAAVLVDGPLSYWRLNESAGPLAKDEMGRVDGTYKGVCTFEVAGATRVGTAVRFDGKTCDVDLGDNFRFPGKAQFSIEAWVRADPTSGGYNHVFTHELRNGAPTDGYALLLDTPTSTYAERIGTNGNESTSAANLPGGQFVHLVATYDGATLTVFVNGVQSVTRAATGTANDISVHAFIGCAGTSNFFLGTIDEVAVYDKALSPMRVKAHYAAAAE